MRDAAPSPIESTLAFHALVASTSRNSNPALSRGETVCQERPPSSVRSTSPRLPPTHATRALTASSPRYCWSLPVGTGFHVGSRDGCAEAAAGTTRANTSTSTANRPTAATVPGRERRQTATRVSARSIGHPAWQTHHALRRDRHSQAHAEVVLRRSDDPPRGGADVLLADVAVPGAAARAVVARPDRPVPGDL